MQFNTDKCHSLSIHRKQNPIQCTYTMENKNLTAIQSHSYLGIELQQDFKWTKQIENTTFKAQRTLNTLKRNLKQASSTVRSQAYKTLVRPQLEYASAVWDPHTKTDIDKIDKIQKRAARWTLSDYSRYTSVTSLQQKLHWQPLNERRSQTRLMIFYKIIHLKIAIPIPSYLIPPTRTTRHTPTLQAGACFIPLQPHTDAYKNSFFPRTIPCWNALPATLQALPTPGAFKQGLAPGSAPTSALQY